MFVLQLEPGQQYVHMRIAHVRCSVRTNKQYPHYLLVLCAAGKKLYSLQSVSNDTPSLDAAHDLAI